jgi:acyl carrier protein
MTIREIEEKVRAYICESFLPEEEAEKLRDEDDLLRVLDSLQLLRMVVQFESTFAIKVHDGDLTPENLGSVKKVAAFVVRKRGNGQAVGPLSLRSAPEGESVG